MITFYIEANSLGELRLEVCRALSLIMPPDALGGNYVTQATPARHFTSPPSTYNQERPYEGDQGPLKRDLPQGAPDKPRRKHRATRPPVATPDPVPEPVGDIGLGGYEEIAPEEALQDLTPVSTPLTDSLTNEKVKADVIGQLADLFAAGKVKMLRSILDQYGGGAKSFPEIDAARFPAILEALNKGIAA